MRLHVAAVPFWGDLDKNDTASINILTKEANKCGFRKPANSKSSLAIEFFKYLKPLMIRSSGLRLSLSIRTEAIVFIKYYKLPFSVQKAIRACEREYGFADASHKSFIRQNASKIEADIKKILNGKPKKSVRAK